MTTWPILKKDDKVFVVSYDPKLDLENQKYGQTYAFNLQAKGNVGDLELVASKLIDQVQPKASKVDEADTFLIIRPVNDERRKGSLTALAQVISAEHLTAGGKMQYKFTLDWSELGLALNFQPKGNALALRNTFKWLAKTFHGESIILISHSEYYTIKAVAERLR